MAVLQQRILWQERPGHLYEKAWAAVETGGRGSESELSDPVCRIDPASPSYLGVAADGNFVDRTLLYNSGKTWRYEAEQVWRWIPLAGLALSGGKHVLTLAVLASGVRIDRLYLTRKGDRPPVDCSWE